ncbi:MAG: ZIP family metal transporter [Candidatus Heimdallarchaeota archaeon]|nr:MAG: ZIP family metal transporter [Candidatus Heimdallarchaeota archaeon]
MLPEPSLAIIFSLIASISTSIGIIIIWKYQEWGQRNVFYFMSFAAGLLIAVSLLHVIPESIELNVSAPLFVLLGFLSLHVYDRFLDDHGSFNREEKQYYSLGIISAWGIGLHSFVDGIIYMVTFNVSMITGVVTSTAMVFHEIPEGIITFLLLKKAGFSERRSLIFSFLAASISTPLGAILAFPFVYNIGDAQLGILLALSAGTLLYIGASRLLPESEMEASKFNLTILGLGIIFIVFILLMSH